LSYTELAWIRKNNRLTVPPEVKALLGWTAEEVAAMSVRDLMTPDTLRHFKEHYYRGPADKVIPQAFEAHLIHRDGYVVCCHISVVCQYDSGGDLVEAWGCARCQQRQCDQNALLAWWPKAKAKDLKTVIHVVETYAAL